MGDNAFLHFDVNKTPLYQGVDDSFNSLSYLYVFACKKELSREGEGSEYLNVKKHEVHTVIVLHTFSIWCAPLSYISL